MTTSAYGKQPMTMVKNNSNKVNKESNPIINSSHHNTTMTTTPATAARNHGDNVNGKESNNGWTMCDKVNKNRKKLENSNGDTLVSSANTKSYQTNPPGIMSYSEAVTSPPRKATSKTVLVTNEATKDTTIKKYFPPLEKTPVTWAPQVIKPVTKEMMKVVTRAQAKKTMPTMKTASKAAVTETKESNQPQATEGIFNLNTSVIAPDTNKPKPVTTERKGTRATTRKVMTNLVTKHMEHNHPQIATTATAKAVVTAMERNKR